MAGSGFGTVFRITTWGESHGKALGVVVDGCPAGIPLSEEDITSYMNRRRPNGGVMSTQRNEEDKVEILSGVFEGKTIGTPLCMIIRNTDQRSGDYEALRELARPGHGDLPGFVRYDGFNYMYFGIGNPGMPLRSNTCQNITEDKFHRLWISFEEYTEVLDLNTLQSVVPKNKNNQLKKYCTNNQ